MSERRGARRPLRALDAPGRIAGVDLARGLAVVGMLAAHLLVVAPFSWGEPATWIAVAEGRSSILFALLAGVSIALTSGGVRPVAGRRRRAARTRLVVRAGALWVLGMLLILTGLPVYVILPAYAVLFLIAIPFLSLRPPALLSIAAAGLVVMPFVQAGLDLLPLWSTPAGEHVGLVIGWAYPFPLWSAYLLAGLGIGRLDLRDGRVAALLVAGGAGVAMVGYGLGGLWTQVEDPGSYPEIVASVQPHSGGLPEAIGGTGFVVAVLGVCLLLCRTPARWPVLPLRAAGSMPLTAYTAQLLIWAVWAQVALGGTGSLVGFRALQPFWPIALAVVAGCTLWALTVGRGPLETLLARLSGPGRLSE